MVSLVLGFLLLPSLPVRADTKLFISVSLSGATVIGMVGYYFHVTFSTRVAKQLEEKGKDESSPSILALNSSSFTSVPGPTFDSLPVFDEAKQEDLVEIPFFSYRW